MLEATSVQASQRQQGDTAMPPAAVEAGASVKRTPRQKSVRLGVLGLIVAAWAAFAAIVGWYRLPLGYGPPIGGYYCPLCGGTRAWWAFCHGHWLASFALNPLVWLMSPVIVYASASGAAWFVTGQPLPGFRDPWTWPRRWFWPVAIAVIGFTVLRNIPVWPLTWLAP